MGNKLKFYVLEQYTETPEYKISLYFDELIKKISSWFEEDSDLKKYDVFSIEKDQNVIGTRHSIDVKFTDNVNPMMMYFMVDETNLDEEGKIKELYVELKIFNEEDNSIEFSYQKSIESSQIVSDIVKEFIENAKSGKGYEESISSNESSDTEEPVE